MQKPYPTVYYTVYSEKYVDVISSQYFSRPEQICPDFQRWHELTGKPILLADASTPGRDPGNQG